MTSSSSPRLAAADRLLLRSVFAWARANGWRVVHWDGAHDRQWSADGDGKPVVNVYRPNYGDNGEDNFGDLSMRVYFFDGSYRCVTLPSMSVVEAIDVLVSLGILPAHFSSAFAAGRDSVYDRIEYRIMAPDRRVPRSSTNSTIQAFQDLGWWRRNGWPTAWLERRYGKEPTDWERVDG